MKRLHKSLILGLALIPGLVTASHFKTEDIYGGYLSACTYYKGYAWNFYVFEQYENHIDYIAYRLEDDGSITTHHNAAYGNNELTDDQLACCVFQDKIYVFWRSYYDNYMYYDVFDGSHWAGKTKLESHTKESPFGMAVAVLGDKLYLFYQGPDYIEFRHTSDGEHWSSSEVLGGSNGDHYVTGGNIAAVTYMEGGEQHEQKIMLAWPSSDNARIQNGMFYEYAGGNDLTLWPDLNQYAECVALAAGSVEGGGTGYEVVQIFALGKKDAWTGRIPYLRAEYYGDFWKKGSRYSDWETIVYISVNNYSYSAHWYVPVAATNYKVFGSNAHNLRQEVWMLYPGNVARWDSDQCVMVQDTSQQLYDEDTYKKFWTMIGVVEGPPPYALNGRDATSDDVTGYSSLSYAVETDTAVSSSSTTDDEFFVSAGGPGEYWPGVGVSLTLGMEHHFCESHTYSTKLTHTFYPSNDTFKFWVYRYYLRPTMRRLKYEIRDWKGNSLDRYTYIFSVSDMDLHVDAVNMRDSLPYDPRIWDPATYQDRHIADDISHYDIKAGRNINWVIGSQVELEISEAKELESSQSFTETMEIDVGMEGVFDIGVKGSITTEHSVSTDSINTVTVMANSPEPPSGYSGSYIKEFSFYPYWLEPKDSVPYWIPDEFKHQRPWCITYEVSEVDYDSTSASEGLAEDESGPLLRLYPIYPNPAGPEVTVRYALPKETRVSLKVYDASGRMLKVLADEEQSSGVHSVRWNGCDEAGRRLSSGVYFCRLQTGDGCRISRIVLSR